jgi:RHS repeat-associated protein
VNTYIWNARNQLIAINGGSMTASFTYDALWRRQSKTVNGASTEFFYDGLTLVQELGGSTVTLLTGLGIDEYLTRTDATGTRTLLTDALGSTVALSDPAGAVQSEYTYEPFGATTETSPDANPFQYTGRENDGTGLYYYRARYYHPGRQRFLKEDPIRFSGGVNFYTYAGNNPIMNSDPFGLCADPEGRASATVWIGTFPTPHRGSSQETTGLLSTMVVPSSRSRCSTGTVCPSVRLGYRQSWRSGFLTKAQLAGATRYRPLSHLGEERSN